MRIINALLAAWHTKTTAEKIKTVLHGIVTIGGSVVGNTIGDKCSEGRGKVEQVCARVTGWALGGAVANTASKSVDEYVDTINELVQARKEKNKEESANA